MTSAPDPEPALGAPLATYSERLLEVRRELALYDDRVVVTARWLFRGRFRHVVPLRDLTPSPRPLLVRYRVHRYAGWVLAAGSLGFAVIYWRAEGGPLGPFGFGALAGAAAGALLLALSFPLRRLECARFVTRSGRPGRDVGATGGDRERFQTFVAAVEQQLRRR